MRRTIFWLIIFLNICFVAGAQPGDPPGDPGDPVPISGIEILLAAGALFGAKKLIRKEKS